MSPPPEPDAGRESLEKELQKQNAHLQSCVDRLLLQNRLMLEKEKLHEQQQAQVQAHAQHTQHLPPPVFAPPFRQQGHSRSNSHSGHARQMSKGHSRRHSLAVSEARRAAHQRTNTPQGLADFVPAPPSPARSPDDGFNFGGDPGPIANLSLGEPYGGAPGPVLAVPSIQYTSYSGEQYGEAHEFKFPPSPQRKGHARSQSVSSAYSPQRHRRTGSWREPTPQTQGHRPRASDASDIGRAQGGGNQGSRRLLFVPYLSQAQVPELVSNGMLVTGLLRVDRKNRSHAYVTTPALDADVFIEGSRDRNRALDGDVVAVELLDVDDVWAQRQEKEERKRLRDADEQEPAINDSSHGSLVFRPNQKRSDDTEIEGQTLFLGDEIVLQEDKPLYSGHVVAVLERPAGQLFSGTLGVLRPSSQAAKERQHARQLSTPGFVSQNQKSASEERPKIVWFRPTDKHIPLMAIPTEQAPPDLFDSPAKYASQVFVAQIKRWPITSLHPFGSLVERLGGCDTPGVVEQALFRDANFDRAGLTPAARAELATVVESLDARAKELPLAETPAIWLRDDLAASVHGSTLAVHVLDLAPSIRVNSVLEKELHMRSVGVYAGATSSPLLGDPEATSSVALQVDRRSPVLTIQIALDGSQTRILNESIVPTAGSAEQLREAANTFRKHRGFDPLTGQAEFNLDLFLDINALSLDAITHTSPEELIVSELEHAANASVAAELLKCPAVGVSAVVRQQEPPPPANVERLVQFLRRHGVHADATNAATLRKSLAKALPPAATAAATVQLFKAVGPQKFTPVSGAQPGLGHYWFNLGAYTNVTRPLQRYGDQLAARQVHTVLGSAALPPLAHNECAELSFRHECALKLQTQALHLDVARMLAAAGPQTHIGKVVGVQKSSFDVVVPALCLEKRVYCDQLNIERCDYRAATDELNLKWLPDDAQAPELVTATASANLILKKDNVQTVRPLADAVVQVHAVCEGNVRPIISFTAVNPFHSE